MSRPRLIPDAEIFAAILRQIAAAGEKSVAFSTIARATGLAAPSLVQRYGSAGSAQDCTSARSRLQLHSQAIRRDPRSRLVAGHRTARRETAAGCAQRRLWGSI